MTPNFRTRARIFPGVNLRDYQGINAHEYWVSGVFYGVECVWGAETPGIRLACFGRTYWYKFFIIRYLCV